MSNRIAQSILFVSGMVLFCSTAAVGAPVTQDQAAQAANTFIKLMYPSGRQQTAMTTTAAGQSARAVQTVRPVVGSGGQTIGYIAELDSTGYVLLSSDDEAPPVKCYTEAGSYEQLPPEFLNILTTELAEDLFVLSGMTQAKAASLPGTSQTQTAGGSKYKQQWSALLNPEPPDEAPAAMSTSTAAGTVLLTTTWDQADPYNYYCPAAVGGPGGRAFAGCTAAAVSQILRYWNRPDAVLYDHSYYDGKGSCTGTRSISTAGMAAYNWANMPNSITTGSSTVQKQAIGQLMYHAAVALESDFEGIDPGTGAYPTDVPTVLRTYFAYTCSNYLQKASFTSTDWYTRIAADIGANKPIFYAMWQSNNSGGHAVVCDGYRSGNQIHLNLGWSGSGNAWYNIDSVSAGGYTWTKHGAVFGIAPIDMPGSLSNDHFSSAKILTESSGTISSNSMNATVESGEPAHAGRGPYKSVWYTFTPASSGTLTIDTHGSAFDTVLAVYTGSSVSGLSAVASNDDDGSSENNSGLTAIPLTAGTTYRIAVAGYSSSSAGSFKLNWIFSGSSTGTLQFKSSAYSVEENGGNVRLFVSRSGGASGAASVSYSTTNGSAVSGADYIGTSGTLNWPNGDFTDKYFDISIIDDSLAEGSETFAVVLSTVNGAVMGSPDKATVTIVGPNDQSLAPANDHFTAAKPLSVYSGTVTGNTMNATAEIGEPSHAGRGPYKSVWYSFTSAKNGTLTINTHGSAFDTVLAIYTGSSIAGLTVIASNDDDGSSKYNSGLTAVPLTAGTTYRIAVASYGSTESGSVTLNWFFSDQSTPANRFLYTTAGGKATITGYIGSGGAVTIPSAIDGIPVASIGARAFYSCDSLVSIVIPDNVVSIGSQAFYSCDSLTSVGIGSGTTSIGSQAFFSCDGLASIIISNSAVKIESQAFYSCGKLTNVMLGQRAVSIGSQAFYSCESLTNIIIPGSITSISDQAFIFCDNLKSIYFKGNAPRIGPNVFLSDNLATVYRSNKTTGWPTIPGFWAGRPTALWNPPYSLFVGGGTGGGDSYTNGQKVIIAANSPAIGKAFDRWTGAIIHVANATLATTTVTMPAQDIALTATYKTAYYKLTVIGGIGGGSFTNNQRVTIRASVPAGMKFSQWNDGDTNASRIITMPPEPVAYTANFIDIQKPAITITAPTAALRTTNGQMLVKGTATDNKALTNVLVQLNGGSWMDAGTTNGFKNWSLPVTLTPGTNTVRAYAQDAGGNRSSTSQVVCTYVVYGSLTILTNGPGTVTRAPAGIPEVGKLYTLTAAPKAGFGLRDWTDGEGIFVSTNKALTFLMASNRTYTASFIDVQKPVAAITYPTASLRTTNGVMTVKGTAVDNISVSNVLCRINNGTWQNADTTNGWKNWTTPFTLTAGSNRVEACSIDSTGNVSAFARVSFSYVVYGTLNIRTNGPGSVTRTPAGIPEIGKTYTLTAMPKAGFGLREWTDGTDAVVSTNKVLSFCMTANQTLTANFADSQKPVVTITAPTAALRTTNGQMLVKGTASDNVSVTNVLCRINGGVWSNADTTNGWKNWSVPFALTAGSNRVEACSLDSTGNTSALVGVSFSYVVYGDLSVQTNGSGTVTRTPAGVPEVGKSYTLTATPGAGYGFASWTGDAAGTNRTVTFLMTSNAAVAAHFTDTQKPLITISSPTASLRISSTSAVYAAKGTATDNKGVAGVMVQVNGGSWLDAATTNSFKNWSLPVTLTPGTNTIRAYSMDAAGNRSATSSVNCTYVEIFTLADYCPLPAGAEWLYDGTDEYGRAAKIRTRIISTNHTIICYTGRSLPRAYATNSVRLSQAYLNRTTLAVYEAWDDYMTGNGQYGELGGDYYGDAVRFDRGLVLPAQMILGQTVSLTRDAYVNGQFVFPVTAGMKLIEKTSVTVPAGTFTNVLRVQFSMTFPDGSKTMSDEWWAKSAGQIKYLGKSSDDLSNYELIQYLLPTALSTAASELSSSDPNPVITVDGDSGDWTDIPRTSFSYLFKDRAVVQEAAANPDGNQVSLLLTGCPFSTSDNVLVYFKLRLMCGDSDELHTVDLWTSGTVFYGMIDGQALTGLEAVVLNGVLEARFSVLNSGVITQVTIEEVGCGIDSGDGTLQPVFKNP